MADSLDTIIRDMKEVLWSETSLDGLRTNMHEIVERLERHIQIMEDRFNTLQRMLHVFGEHSQEEWEAYMRAIQAAGMKDARQEEIGGE